MTSTLQRLGEFSTKDRTGVSRSIGFLVGLSLWITPAIASLAQEPEARYTLVETARTTLSEVVVTGRLNNAISSLCYSPDGSTLAVGMRDPNTILLLDPATLAVKGRLKGHLKIVSRLAFLPDGKTLVSSAHDGSVRLWDLASKEQRILLGEFQGNIRGLAISPDGKHLYIGESTVGYHGVVQDWDTNGKLLGSLKNFDHGVEDLSVSPDGKLLATASRDNKLRLWNLNQYTEEKAFEVEGSFPSTAKFVPHQNLLVSTFYKDMTLRGFDTTTMEPKYSVAIDSESFIHLAVSPDGSMLLTSDAKRIQLRRSSDGGLLASQDDTGGLIAALGFSPDGRSVAVGGALGLLRVYKINPR